MYQNPNDLILQTVGLNEPKNARFVFANFFRSGMEKLFSVKLNFSTLFTNFFACVRFPTILDENAIIHFQKTYDTLDDLTIGNVDNDFDLRSSNKVVKFVNNFV